MPPCLRAFVLNIGSKIDFHDCMGCFRISSRPPPVRVSVTFLPCSRRIYTTRLVQYNRNLFSSFPVFRTSFWRANSSTLYCLIYGSCSSARDFASGFLQIPPHDGHPCFWLTLPTAIYVADFHRQVTAHAGHTRTVQDKS